MQIVDAPIQDPVDEPSQADVSLRDLFDKPGMDILGDVCADKQALTWAFLVTPCRYVLLDNRDGRGAV